MERLLTKPAMDYARAYGAARIAARVTTSETVRSECWAEAGKVNIRARRGGSEALQAIRRLNVILDADQSINTVEWLLYVAGFVADAPRC